MRERMLCDASLQTSRGPRGTTGRRTPSPTSTTSKSIYSCILQGIMAAGHASRYKTGLRSEPNRNRNTARARKLGHTHRLCLSSCIRYSCAWPAFGCCVVLAPRRGHKGRFVGTVRCSLHVSNPQRTAREPFEEGQEVEATTGACPLISSQ